MEERQSVHYRRPVCGDERTVGRNPCPGGDGFEPRHSVDVESPGREGRTGRDPARRGLDRDDPRKRAAACGETIIENEKKRTTMKFLSIYKTAETGVLPTKEEMARMGKLVEDGMKAGFLLAVGGVMPSASGARARLSTC